MTFGERLRILRKAKGLNQRQLAEYSRVHYHCIRDYENNRNLPHADNLIKICNTLHVSADYLLGLVADERAFMEGKAI